MGFAEPAGFWYGLALGAIVLMYLIKRKYVDTPVSSHLLWNRVLQDMEANRPWQRLRNRLLMFLQLLAAALLTMALASPYLTTHAPVRGHVIIVLDHSASMQALATGGEQAGVKLTRLEAVRSELIRHLKRASRAREFSLIVPEREPILLLSRETSLERVEQILLGVKPYWGKPSLGEAISFARALAEGEPDAAILVATDGGWKDSGNGELDQIQVLTPPDFRTDNARILSFGVAASEGGNDGVAAVRYDGPSAMPVELSVYAENRLVNVLADRLEPGEQKTYFFDALPDSEWYRLELQAEDALEADNVAYALAAGTGRKTVLWLGEGNFFLEKAIGLAGGDVWKALPGADGLALPETRMDIVVLEGLDPAQLADASLRKLVEQAPLWRLPDSDSGGASLAGAADGIRVTDHPIMRYISMRDVHIAQVANPVEAGLEAVASLGGVPLILAGNPDGRPVLEWTFSPAWTDFPLRAEFPVFVQNALDWLSAGRGEAMGSFVAGSPLAQSLSPSAATAEWVPVDVPTGFGQHRTDDGSDRVIGGSQLVAPQVPGLYALAERNDQQELVRSRLAVVTIYPGESDLAASNDGRTGTTVGSEVPASRPGNEVPVPLAGWVIAAALAVMIWEWEVYRRGAQV